MKTTTWLSDAKAVLVILSLEIWVLFSLNNYVDIYLKKHGRLSFFSFKVLIPFIILLLIKWLFFWKDDRWKDYVQHFDNWPKEKNDRGGWLVAFVVLFCLANLIFSFYLNPPSGGW